MACLQEFTESLPDASSLPKLMSRDVLACASKGSDTTEPCPVNADDRIPYHSKNRSCDHLGPYRNFKSKKSFLKHSRSNYKSVHPRGGLDTSEAIQDPA